MTNGRTKVSSSLRRKGELNSSTNGKEEKNMGVKSFFKKFIHDEEGATAVEYAVMIVLIIVVCLSVITLLGGEIKDAFNTVADTLAWKNSS